MQSYIRPLGEDILWSSGPDEICASSPYHDRGLKGPVPDQGWRKPVWPIMSSTRFHLASCGRTPPCTYPAQELSKVLASILLWHCHTPDGL